MQLIRMLHEYGSLKLDNFIKNQLTQPSSADLISSIDNITSTQKILYSKDAAQKCIKMHIDK